MTKATLGTISEGTLRIEDLMSAFLDTLNSLIDPEPAYAYTDLRDEAAAWLDTDEDKRDAEYGADIVNDLIDALNEYAPAFCYFGARKGGGADFGFWPT